MQVKPVYGKQPSRDSNWSGSVATIIATAVVLIVVGFMVVDTKLSHVHVHHFSDEVNANDRYVANGLQNIRSMAGNLSHIFQHSGGIVKSALDEMPLLYGQHPTPPKKVQKIAYIFAGSARSFVCPQVHWSIKAHLIDALGGEPHSFVRLSLEDNKNVKTGTGIIFKPEFDEREINETMKILNPDILERFSYSDQVEEMTRLHPEEIHTVFRENDQRRYSMFFHRCQAYKLMLRYEKKNNVRFDWVVLARVDAAWLEPILPIDAYMNDRVWVTETGYDVFNDQFMLIPRQFSDYLYDLDTKVKKGVYCLGGPDVETWKCNTTELRRRGVTEAKIQSVLPYCCPDILDKNTNEIGRSERIHYKHMETGEIPLGIGRFPTFLTRRIEDGTCISECFRIYAYHYKEYLFRFDGAVYPYLKAPIWPDTRGRTISARDYNLCYVFKENVYPWKPIKAVDWYTAIEQRNYVPMVDSKYLQELRRVEDEKNPKYAIDYTKKLTDPAQRLHPSILLNPKDTEMWRIHPTWNTEGCLTFNYKTKQAFWEACKGHWLSTTNIYMPNQLFFLYVVPAKPRALQFIKSTSYHAPSWFPESTYNHPVGNITKVVMVNAEPKSMNFRRGAYCLTASKLALEAPVQMTECTSDPMDPMQTFLTVRGLADGSHAQTTTGQLRFAARPDLCACRHDNKAVDYSIYPENNNFFVYRCEWRAHYHKNTFEFELIGS